MYLAPSKVGFCILCWVAAFAWAKSVEQTDDFGFLITVMINYQQYVAPFSKPKALIFTIKLPKQSQHRNMI